MNKLSLLVVMMVIGFAVISKAEEPKAVPAVLSEGQLKGDMFFYKFIAYEQSSKLKSNWEAYCGYGEFEGKPTLKSVTYNLLISAEFKNPESKIVHKGKINVREAINDCMNQKSITVNSPVSLHFPEISVPSIKD